MTNFVNMNSKIIYYINVGQLSQQPTMDAKAIVCGGTSSRERMLKQLDVEGNATAQGDQINQTRGKRNCTRRAKQSYAETEATAHEK